MAVCSYYQMGRCKFGARCRNEHPGERTHANAVGAFAGSAASAPSRPPFFPKVQDIIQDLTPGVGRPTWIFSSYAPGKDAPVQLFEGPDREISPEEMRVMHYMAVESNTVQQAIEHVNRLYTEVEAQMNSILKNTDAAIKYIVDGEQRHPNRWDVIDALNAGTANPINQDQQLQLQQQQRPNPLAQVQGSSFGRSSGFGQPTNPAQPAFGQPMQPSFGTPAFGQKLPSISSLGQPSSPAQPAFGQPMQPSLGTPAFGQTLPSISSLSQPSFGQPSQPQPQLQPAFGQPAFGQTSRLQPAFGQPSFGQTSQPQPAFGQPAFGQTSRLQPAFGQPSFGQTSQLQPAFGQPAFGQPTYAQQPQPPQMPNPFGQTMPAPMQPAVNGQPNPLQQPAFGQLPASRQSNLLETPASSSSPFAQLPPTQPEQQSGFNQSVGTASGGFGNASNTTGGAFPGNAQPTNTTGAATNQSQLSIQEGQAPERASHAPEGLNMRPALNGETVRDPQTNKLTRWKGQPVLYVKGDPRYQHPDDPSVFMHIFFPDKQPTIETLGDTQGIPEDYTPEIEETYKQAKSAGRFTKGVPKVPPKPEWCSFDL